MNLLELAQNIRLSISEDDLQSAISQLKSSLENTSELDEVILQSARYKDLATKIKLGMVLPEWANTEKNRIHKSLLDLVRELEYRGKAETQIFICYHRQNPSRELANTIYQKLKEEKFTPFMDTKDILPGQDWAKGILGPLKASDYLILLLSPEANNSEMVLKEVEEARLQYQKTGNPVILPIRVQWPKELALNYKLGDWLYRIQYLNWTNERDTPEILSRLIDVIRKRQRPHVVKPVSSEEADTFAPKKHYPPTPVAPLEIPQGGVQLNSPFYISRENELNFIQRITDAKALLRIRGPRQYGKTSLLSRIVAYAKERNYKVVTMDFQNLGENTLSNSNTMIWEFSYKIAQAADLEDDFEDYWDKKLLRKPDRDKKQVVHTFIQQRVLPRLESNLLVAIDEADRIFPHKIASDEFFLMLRSWHEYANTEPIWERFKLAISYSTEAKLAISNLNASPFNVGEEARLDPFTEDQVGSLLKLHGLSLTSNEHQTIMELLGGQPYLIRRCLYLLAQKRYTFQQLIEEAIEDQGPFSDHLRHHLVNIKQFPELSEALKNIINAQKCKNPLIAGRLSASGLTRGTPPSDVSLACGLYQKYFKDKI